MKKLFVLLCMIFTLSITNAATDICFLKTDYHYNDPNIGYGDVYIECNDRCCHLFCYITGSTICNWSEGWWNCITCGDDDEQEDIFYASDATDMWDHAIDQIVEEEVYSGTYHSNIIQGGFYYYRTVEWIADIVNETADISIYITKSETPLGQ